MLLLDKTAGEIGELVGRLVGQSLAPPDVTIAFEQVGGDFWYYLLRIYSKLQRGQAWAARHDIGVWPIFTASGATWCGRSGTWRPARGLACGA